VLGCAPLDEGVVLPVGEVVEVLHHDDGRDGPRLGELDRGDAAEAEVTDQALLLQLGQRAERGCCVVPTQGLLKPGAAPVSDGEGEFVEGDRNAPIRWLLGGRLVVSTP
jgi:hypothetical protein